MKKEIKKETLQDDENEIDNDIVDIETKINNNKKYYYLAITVVVILCAVVFGTLAGTGTI